MKKQTAETMDQLYQDMLTMSTMCEHAIFCAIKALTGGNMHLAHQISCDGIDISRMERHLEEKCMKFLIKEHPPTKDLRHISSALKMVADMGRIGNQTEDIAHMVLFMDGRYPGKVRILEDMAYAAIQMVNDSIRAYTKTDLAQARSVIVRETTVEAYFDRIKKGIIEHIHAHPEDSEYALDFLMVTKYFARIANHAASIAGWVVYAITGAYH